jgi:hypothetical protein
VERFDVCDVVIGRFIIRVTLFDLKIRKKWYLAIVYGAAQEEDKEDFLRDLGEICREQDLPLLVGGDFNLLRESADKITNSLADGMICSTISLIPMNLESWRWLVVSILGPTIIPFPLWRSWIDS